MFDEGASSEAMSSWGHLAQDWLIDNMAKCRGGRGGALARGRWAKQLSPVGVQAKAEVRLLQAVLRPWAASPCCCPDPWPGFPTSSLQPSMLACVLARSLGVTG